MKKKFILSVFIVLSFLLSSFGLTGNAHAAQDSKGTEFWLIFMQNYSGDSTNLQLFITSDVDTSGKVEIPGLTWSQAFTVTADTTTTVNIPISAMLSTNGIHNKGIHLTAEDEVTVYGLNQIQYTTDAYLSLPIDVLNVKYFVLAYEGWDSEEFAIVAPYDNTSVEYTIPGDATQTIMLNQGEAFFHLGTGATGTYIESNKPVGVFGGHHCVNIPPGYSACDHIVEQLPPLAAWGKTFYTVPLATRTNGDTFRILASADGTAVIINGAPVATLNAGEFHERIINGLSVIETSEPVLVAQYSNGSSYDGVTSDPFMMIVPPIEQALNYYTFSTPGSGFSLNYVNVLVPTSTVGSIILDGSAVNSALFIAIGGTVYSGAQIPASVGSHTITGPEAFGIHSYGFANYDSYGYPGGMAFEFINPKGDANSPICEEGEIINNVYHGTVRDDRPSEDVDGDGILDPGEDLNGNGQIDEDTGIFLVELISGNNVTLTVAPFVPGEPLVNYTVELMASNQEGTATVRAKDGAGNECEVDIVLGGGAPPVICGDFDHDDDVDEDDYNAFLSYFGSTPGDPNWNAEADFDLDGQVALPDFAAWYQCYMAYISSPG
jgi:hypothetical protein